MRYKVWTTLIVQVFNDAAGIEGYRALDSR